MVDNRLGRLLMLTLCLGILGLAQAHNKVVVIPMAGDDLEPLANVVSVAKLNGDFDDPLAAIASISDASESNPYLIVVAPGNYDLDMPIVMKEWVSITGSGKRTTYFKSNVSNTNPVDASVVTGANNATLSDLTIEAKGDNTEQTIGVYNLHVDESFSIQNLIISLNDTKDGVGIYNDQSSPAIDHVAITVGQGESLNTRNIGIKNLDNSSPSVLDSRIEVVGVGRNIGISNVFASRPVLQNVDIKVSGNFAATGIFCADSTPSLNDVTIRATSNVIGRGVHLELTSNAKLRDVVVDVRADNRAYGLHIEKSTPQVSDSRFTVSGDGQGYGVYVNGADAEFTNIDTTVTTTGFGSGGYLVGAAKGKFMRSTLSGNTYGLWTSSDSFGTVLQSSLTNGTNIARAKCLFTDNGANAQLNEACAIP